MGDVQDTERNGTGQGSGTPVPPARVVIADDHAVVREGLAMLMGNRPEAVAA